MNVTNNGGTNCGSIAYRTHTYLSYTHKPHGAWHDMTWLLANLEMIAVPNKPKTCQKLFRDSQLCSVVANNGQTGWVDDSASAKCLSFFLGVIVPEAAKILAINISSSTIRSRHEYRKRREQSYEGSLLTALSTVYLSFLICPFVFIPTCALDSRSRGRNLPCAEQPNNIPDHWRVT